MMFDRFGPGPGPGPATSAVAERRGLLGMTLTATVQVAAAPQLVWKILTEFEAYSLWNRSIPWAEGDLVVGGMLNVEIAWPGLKRGPYRLKLLAVEPGRELRWLGRFGPPGLMDGVHRFLIDGPPAGPTKVTQSEDFSGLLVPLFAPWLRDNVLRGFIEMNAGLSAIAEEQALHR